MASGLVVLSAAPSAAPSAAASVSYAAAPLSAADDDRSEDRSTVCGLCGTRGIRDQCDKQTALCKACRPEPISMRLVVPDHLPNIGGARDAWPQGGGVLMYGCGHFSNRPVALQPVAAGETVYVGESSVRGRLTESQPSAVGMQFRVTLGLGLSRSDHLAFDVTQLDWVVSGEVVTVAIFDAAFYSNRCTECGCGMGSMNPRQLCGKTFCHNEDSDSSEDIDPDTMYEPWLTTLPSGSIEAYQPSTLGAPFAHAAVSGVVCVRGDVQYVYVQDDTYMNRSRPALPPFRKRRVTFTPETTDEGYLNPIVTPPVEACYTIVLAAVHRLGFAHRHTKTIPLGVWDRIFWFAAEYFLDDSECDDCVLLRGAWKGRKKSTKSKKRKR